MGCISCLSTIHSVSIVRQLLISRAGGMCAGCFVPPRAFKDGCVRLVTQYSRQSWTFVFFVVLSCVHYMHKLVRRAVKRTPERIDVLRRAFDVLTDVSQGTYRRSSGSSVL